MLLSRIWIWKALDLLINQDPPTKDFSGFRQTERENLAQEEREKESPFSPIARAWLRCVQRGGQMLLSFQTDFLLFFHFLPPLFFGGVPMLHGLQRCCYLEVPSSQEKWFFKQFWEPQQKLRKVHLSRAVHVRKIIGEKKLSDIRTWLNYFWTWGEPQMCSF